MKFPGKNGRLFPDRRGQNNGNAKLSDAQAEEMRRQRAGGAKLLVLGRRFKVHYTTAGQICRGERRG